jgi:HEPN domain-containing protein
MPEDQTPHERKNHMLTSKKADSKSESVELWLRDLEDTITIAKKNFEIELYVSAAFYIQMSVEKALKTAIVALKQQAPPKVHNLVRLYGEIQGLVKLDDAEVGFLRVLTTASHETRYVDAAPALPSEIYTEKLVKAYLDKALPIIAKIAARIKEA